MLVSVLVVSRDRPADLMRLVTALSAQVVPDGVAVELVLVNDGAADAVSVVCGSSLLGHWTTRYLSHSGRGKSRALNAALGVASGSVFVFTDDDVVPPPNWLASILSHIGSGRWSAVAGGIRIAPMLERVWLTPLHRAYLAESHPWAPNLGNESHCQLVGANMAVQREIFRSIPGFDCDLGPGALGFGDDTLLACRLRRLNFRIGFAPVYVEHHFDPSRLGREGFLEAARKRGRSAAHIAYHWEQRSVRLASVRLMKQRALLAWRRMVREPWAYDEGAADWEILNEFSLAYFDQYRREAVRPRKYSASEGTEAAA